MNVHNPAISVWIITFNQEKYISQCIEGALMQILDVPFEIVIGEDCSTDKTRQICKDFKHKYPDKIKLIERDSNIGLTRNWIETLKECNGKYIALCEGDDYWTDPLKLQKQIDFLERNVDYSAVAHDVFVLHEVKSHRTKVFDEQDVNGIFEAWNIFLPTCSMLFRNHKILEFFPKDLLKYTVFGGDKLLLLGLASQGKIKFLKEKMATYRINKQSLSIIQNIELSTIRNIHFFRFIINTPLFSGLKIIAQKALLINYGNLALYYFGEKRNWLMIKNILLAFIQIRTLSDIKIFVKDYLLKVYN